MATGNEDLTPLATKGSRVVRPLCYARRTGSGEARLPMRWFRSHRLEVAALALFALACQFVLSFGHVHLDRTAGFSTGRSIAAAVGSAIAAPAGKVTLADLPTSPREKNPDGLGDDFCAICANISLARSDRSSDCPPVSARDCKFRND